MKIENLTNILSDQPKYRFKQAQRAVFIDLIDDWSKSSNFPQALREKLNLECSLKINAEVFAAKDNQTTKALITLEDGLKIETVLLKHKDLRNTVCLSSQVGCSVGCSFCATGQMGFKRNLCAYEIVEQVIFFARLLQIKSQKITNVVFMGMGEPFLNYNNVIAAIKILNDNQGFNLGARKISISTCGIISGIKKLASENLQVNLAISLHAPNDILRSKLMSINKKYPLENLLSAVNDYVKRTSRKVMFEYLMIKGINDSVEHARELAVLLKNKLFMVNLIPYNQTGKYHAVEREKISAFKKVLEHYRVQVTQRYSFGGDIDAACGQLASKNK
ncbi:23S rRNA (adenine(2503)-C(2))-methyltransferase RlmN [Patescibacteria group bacterium]|nr:23S rRNA (adenine(2503)-C(2))-methyltransferase RlmN [Patescibacteria group bacterium]